ncbi:MAG: hypothetical protein EOP61_29710 [Sphingomonadales bacterium]|nr:MAG: hypothetical protein EOP61_29710 [Sphingomonadales bacterium]
MVRNLAAIILSAAIVAGGCAARDFGELPKDAKERALLCGRAGVMLIGVTPVDDKARFDRLADKVRKLSNEDGFYTLFPEGNSDPAKVLGDEAAIQGAVGSHWLTTVNSCFRAYGIEEEPVPALPQAAYDRAIACAASLAYDNLGTQKPNPESRVVYDPQAGYFIHKAAVAAGGATYLVKASDDATTRFQQAATNGAARAWADQCKQEDAKAVKAVAVLPAEEPAALLMCDDVLSFAMEGGMAIGAAQSEQAKRYAGGYRAVHARLEQAPGARADAQLVEETIKRVAEAGRLDQVSDACIARFVR